MGEHFFTLEDTYRNYQRSSNAVFPNPGKIELLDKCRIDFDFQPPSRANDLSSEVDKLSPEGLRIPGNLYCRTVGVFLERLENEKGYGHKVVVCGVRGEALKRQVFSSEVLERPIHQLVTSPHVIFAYNSLRTDLLYFFLFD